MSKHPVGPERRRAEDVRPLRRPRETGGAASRSVSPRLAGSDTGCLMPRNTVVLDESAFSTLDGRGVVAYGKPPLGRADGKGLQTVKQWQPVAAPGAALSKTNAVKGVAGDV